jgi:DNA (cytosine-5)-methyltransferase 1
VFENVGGILTSAWYDFSAEKNLVKKWKKDEPYTVKGLKEFARSLEIKIKSTKKSEMLTELSNSLNKIAKAHKKIHKGEIFRDVFKSFSSIEGYTCQPTLVHAYGFGVPQNRPRVMIMGIKTELMDKSELTPTDFNPELKNASYASQLRNNGGFFEKWDDENIVAPDLIDVISDLDFKGWSEKKPYHKKQPESEFQKLMRMNNRIDEKGREILTDHEFSKHKKHVVKRAKYMIKHNVRKKSDLPKEMRTKKFNQRPVSAKWEGKPSITVTSLPDDYFHYANPRTFSVREWARIQTFPDCHIFCGKRTTGGERRAGNPSEGNWNRDLPKYTQIGNAVPPLLAKAIGERVKQILPEL